MRLFSVAFCALLATPVAALAQQSLPPGPGADAITQVCQGCHDLDTVTAEHHDVEGWHSVLTEMIGYGATLTDAQADQIATYLATNFGSGAPPAAAPAAAPADASGATPAPAAPAPTPDAAPATPAPQ